MNGEFRIFKVDQIWHYRYRIDGRRVQRSTKETEKNIAVAIAEEAFRVAKLRARGEEPEPTLAELVPMWADAHFRTLSQNHIQAVETIGRLHLYGLAGLPLRELTSARVEAARNQFLASHAPSSANHWLATLHLLVSWAIQSHMIREVPWQLRKLKIQRKPKMLLPTSKAQTWLATIDRLTSHDPGVSLVIRLMIGLGLRINEAIKAQWQWVDWERSTYTPGETKGREAWPRPVPGWLLDHLEPLQKPAGSIVPSDPNKRITDQRVREVMKKANHEQGINGLTPHRLRGTYATLLSEAGVPIHDIQRALGHKSIVTTAGYLEVNMERVARAQIIIGEMLNLPRRKYGAPGGYNPQDSEVQELSGIINDGARAQVTAPHTPQSCADGEN